MKIMLDPGAKLPTRAFPYDAGLDLYAKDDGEDIVIAPYGGSVNIDTGVHVQIPQHFCGFVKSKSGLMSKKVVTDGTIDCNYTGSIHVILFNHGEYSYVVKPGTKIAQLVILPCCLPPLEVVDELEETDRGTGGFGSTGLV
jgi:dUTP pyrophosphatase